MRAALFILLLANATFFAWAHWVDRAPRAATTAPADVPELRLAVASAPAATPDTPAQCFSLGPFTDPATSTAAAGTLTAAGFQPHDRLVDADVTDGYWVYVPQLRDAAARRRALATLHAAGVRDAAVVTAPDQSDRVSAGVFTQQGRAELRAAQVRYAGLDAVVEARPHHVSEHWLDFQLRSGAAAPSAGDFAAGSAEPLKLEHCPSG
jgi:hypothetical protein